MSQFGGPSKLIFESGDPGKLLSVLRKTGGQYLSFREKGLRVHRFRGLENQCPKLVIYRELAVCERPRKCCLHFG